MIYQCLFFVNYTILKNEQLTIAYDISLKFWKYISE